MNKTESLIKNLIEAFPTMGHDQRVVFFSKVLELFGPYLSKNWQFWLDIYEVAEKHGVNVLPVHYYSPIPEISAYPDGAGLPLLFEKNFGVDIPPKFQEDFFPQQICKYSSELVDVPMKAAGASEMRWDNSMFGVMDSCVYYTMIRHFSPELVLEIGSGFSTLVASRAASKNTATVIECVEPYPVDFFSKHLRDMEGIKLTVAPVQEVPLERFSSLKENDIFFIDSSHVVKSGSDLEYLLFKVIPTLSSGVIVHIHDIYLPYSYPRNNLENHRRFWNENYVIGAFLANNSTWEVLVSNCTLGTEANLKALCGAVSAGNNSLAESLLPISGGGSLWLRKR